MIQFRRSNSNSAALVAAVVRLPLYSDAFCAFLPRIADSSRILQESTQQRQKCTTDTYILCRKIPTHGAAPLRARRLTAAIGVVIVARVATGAPRARKEDGLRVRQIAAAASAAASCSTCIVRSRA